MPFAVHVAQTTSQFLPFVVVRLLPRYRRCARVSSKPESVSVAVGVEPVLRFLAVASAPDACKLVFDQRIQRIQEQCTQCLRAPRVVTALRVAAFAAMAPPKRFGRAFCRGSPPGRFLYEICEHRKQVALGFPRPGSGRDDDRISVFRGRPGVQLMLEERALRRKQLARRHVVPHVWRCPDLPRCCVDGRGRNFVRNDRFEQRPSVQLSILVQELPSFLHQRPISQAERAVQVAKVRFAQIVEDAEWVVHCELTGIGTT